ncbi:pirin family protein [Puia sp. P3]|uniref:pirin family protein n=1 Tax=Puia sp. P3 TaxID=3423952 RepID=UPI003D671A95
MQKKITHILKGREKEIAPGQTVLQPLPHAEFRFANPFIVLHHMPPHTIAAGSQIRLPMHPHRRFSPELRSCHWQELVRNLRFSSVTFQLQGEGYHLDNAGNEGIIGAGDVQWMFAGKGILHSEGPTPRMLEQGGVQELIQLWINAPSVHKLDEPFYQFAPGDLQPAVLEQEGVRLRLASGHYDDATGPLKGFTPVILISGEVNAGRRVQLSAVPGYWTMLYVVKGALCVNAETIAERQLVLFEKENDELIVTAKEDTQLLYLSAQPIEEPVAARDNFVMNTAEEIEEAIADDKAGRF